MDNDVLNGTDDDMIRAQQERDLGHPLDPGKKRDRKRAGNMLPDVLSTPAAKPVRASRKGFSGNSPGRR